MAEAIPPGDGMQGAEARMLRESIRGFLAREMTEARIAECETAGTLPWEMIGALRQFGYLGGLLPETAGGFGLDYRTWAMMMEEAGYRWLSLRVLLNTVNIVAGLLHHLGDARQKDRWLKPVMAGEMPVWVGITEPDHGSDVASVRTRAEDMGDHWRINGSKLWTTNGVHGRVGILVARTFTRGCEGDLSLFIVDPGETRFEAARVGTMFIKATATSQLAFHDARVPKENLLGPAGKGLRAILTGLNYGRLNVAAGAVGAAQRALDLSTDYVRTRKQFGQVIGRFQLVQKLIVDMTVRTEAARALTDRAAQALDAGLPARKECSIAKLYASEAAHEVASMALQAHGGLGYSTDYPIERLFRDTRGGLIPEGTSEIQTLIIGREILGISAFT
ncbi:MAG: acyl-CoA/acyl-ACP dehydrogenase [Roseovarius sp.]|nr:acyl-CoA/acyl-ACP dehydrogenase [Roseovarius sp.]